MQIKSILSPSGSVRVVRGEGMPQYRYPFEKGDLYVKFDVQFPQNNWISPEKLVVWLICRLLLSMNAWPHGDVRKYDWAVYKMPCRNWRTCFLHDQSRLSSLETQRRLTCRIMMSARARRRANAERPTTTALMKKVVTTGRGCSAPTNSLITHTHTQPHSAWREDTG